MSGTSWRPFVVETYNAHDRGAPAPATIVGIQERPPETVLRGALPNHRIYYPPQSSLALTWDTLRVFDVMTRIDQIYKSGREHGHPNTTPRGYMLTMIGTLDRETKIAVINVHLVNNAFGPVKRGERALRLRLWWQGWRAVVGRRRELRRRGYLVFTIGDLNRRADFWPGEGDRALGKGYDRLRYPRGVELMNAWRGRRNGSDHKPLLARFRLTRGAPASN